MGTAVWHQKGRPTSADAVIEEIFLPVECARKRLDEKLLAKFDGLLVVADMHGNIARLDAAADQARRRNRYLVQVGDLVNRGPSSPECVDRMLHLEEDGNGCMALGNHEIKFAQYMRYNTNKSHGRRDLFKQFERYDLDLLDDFLYRIDRGPLWITFGDYVFVHASFDARMLNYADGPPEDDLLKLAVVGPTCGDDDQEDLLVRQWVDRVPDEVTVVVGHRVTASRCVEIHEGRLGGVVVFADTGSWRDPGAAPAVFDIPF